MARFIKRPGKREAYLSFYGPLSLIFLLMLWALGLVTGFALLQYAGGSAVRLEGEVPHLATDFYLSGTTFFTLGLGDVIPLSTLARVLTVIEAGVGFGFLAVVIGYLPVIYQAFSRREAEISLLDARAGSPPSAGELLRRHHGMDGQDALVELLKDCERWAADLLESHLSYPVLVYFRSQHSNQSWLAALTTVLDASALLMSSVGGPAARQARLTFAMARHAVVDLAQIFSARPETEAEDRLSATAMTSLYRDLAASGLPLTDAPLAGQRLAELRSTYEPYVAALSRRLLQPLPEWHYETPRRDNWQARPWEGSTSSFPVDHF